MDNKVAGIGGLILVAITIIVGVILLTASAQQTGTITNTNTLVNQSLGTLTNGTALYVTNCRALESYTVWNATGDQVVDSSNYTVTNNVLNPITGALSVRVDPQVTVGFVSAWDTGTATLDAVCQPLTYETSSGGRALVGMVLIFFALAIAVVALMPVLKEAGNWK